MDQGRFEITIERGGKIYATDISNVEVDHFLILASDKAERSQPILDMFTTPWREFTYERPVDKTRAWFLPPKVMGRLYHESMRQGDFVFKTDSVRRGQCIPIRVLPPAEEPGDIWKKSGNLSR